MVGSPLRIALLAQNAAGWSAAAPSGVSAAHAGAEGALPVVSWPVRACADRDLVVLLGPASEPVRVRPPTDVAEQLIAPWRELAGRACAWRPYLGRGGNRSALAAGWPRGLWAWPTSSLCRC
ncbi:hypothetical protein O1M63_18735 [Streptomyces mirabilis]|nr:hypothetical protein [Streptomyces mirabilis]